MLAMTLVPKLQLAFYKSWEWITEGKTRLWDIFFFDTLDGFVYLIYSMIIIIIIIFFVWIPHDNYSLFSCQVMD